MTRLEDSLSFLHLELCRVEQDDLAIAVWDLLGVTPIPIAVLNSILLLILESPPADLCGPLTLWLHEPRANVFVGRVSALGRQKLSDKFAVKCRSDPALRNNATD